ncbi:MAG: chorismate synthase [Candidatus Micrarchaeota archaeon]
MNTLGRLLRISIFGESHGECVGIVIDGCPPGLHLSASDLIFDLERRKGSQRKIGTTSRIEADVPLIKTGIFNGRTTGAPILIMFENKDVDSKMYEKLKDNPRPGHADLVAKQKFDGFNDYRGTGHFSGRLTIGLVAAGVIAKKIIAKKLLKNAKNVKIKATIIEVGGIKNIKKESIKKAIDHAVKKNDSVGGIIECRISGLPCSLGEPFFDSAESLISHAIFSIPGVKGIEFGSGFKCASMYGSECNDEIIDIKGKTKTNNAGGINGGITNGNDVVFRIAIRPTSSISKIQNIIDLKTGKISKISIEGRHDRCIALRIPVIVEAISALVFADLMLLNENVR